MQDAIPFDMPNQVPFVVMDARAANDLPVRVLLDTGTAAPFTMIIGPALAARAGLVESGAPAQPSIAAVGDATVAFREARMPRFTVGPLTLRDVRVGISPAVDSVAHQLGAPVDAILGHAFVTGRIISIDYAHRRPNLTAEVGPDRLAIAFSIAPVRPLTLVHATVNGRGPFLMVLDSGASTTLLSPATAAAAGVEANRDAQLGGGGGVQTGGARLGTARIGFGSLTRDSQPVAVADILGPVRTASGAPVEGILGADLFRSGRITLDYGSNRLWYSESESRD